MSKYSWGTRPGCTVSRGVPTDPASLDADVELSVIRGMS
jgi:hypothetical protein